MISAAATCTSVNSVHLQNGRLRFTSLPCHTDLQPSHVYQKVVCSPESLEGGLLGYSPGDALQTSSSEGLHTDCCATFPTARPEQQEKCMRRLSHAIAVAAVRLKTSRLVLHGCNTVYLRPCSLVHPIVYSYHGLHVLFTWGPPLSSHGIVKHLLTGVHPDRAFWFLMGRSTICTYTIKICITHCQEAITLPATHFEESH